jgi:sortase A
MARTGSGQGEQPRGRRPRRGQRRPWAHRLEAALWLTGVVTLAWVGWGYLDAHLYQQRQESLLEAALDPAATAAGAPQDLAAIGDPSGIPADELAGSPRHAGDARASARGAATSPAAAGSDASAAPRGANAAPAAAARRARAAPRANLDALGRLVVPRLGLSVMVAEGIDNRTLRRAAGHIPGTARIGSGGNAGIAGHRDGFFRPLKDVRSGDEVVVTTPGAISRYRVEWAEVVPPEDTSSLRPTTYPALTLVTCYPFHYVGTAPDRYVVRARLIESRASTPADAELLVAHRGR